MTKSIVSLAALAAALAAAPAFAQTAQGDAGQGDAGQEIIVSASRVTTEQREIGSAVSIVTDKDIANNQITFVKDILQDLPGVQVSTDRPGDFTNVSIRGSDNDEVLWLVDGIKLGDPSSTSTQFQADHLTSQDIARIEVLRGNQSSLYGADAIGGVINVITQRATEDGYTVKAAAAAGSYGELNGGASILGKSGPVDFRLTATGYRQTGPSLADPATATSPITESDGYWRYGFSGRVGVQATDTVSLQLIGSWLDSFSDLDNTTSDSSDTVKKIEYSAAVQGSYKSSDGKFKADLTATQYVARRLFFGTFYSPDGDLYRGIRDELSLALSYGGDGPISVAAGGNYERERTTQDTSFSGNFLAGVNTKSGYAEVALRPITGMTITGAGRIDDNSRFGEFDTYRGTFAYVTGPVKFRASYGTGAKAPGLYQLFDPTYGDPNLKPETSHGGDVGVDVALGGKVTAQLTYFFNRKKNEINFDASKPPFGGYGQFGRTKAQGVELGLTAQPLPWLGISQSFTYLDHKVDDAMTGVYVASGRPKYSGTTSVTVTPIQRASFTARVRYRDGDASGFGGVTHPYAVADLLGSFRITERVEIYGRLVNLFNKQYQMTYGTNTLGLSAYGGVRVSF
jgi:vitamin B12 transporter